MPSSGAAEANRSPRWCQQRSKPPLPLEGLAAVIADPPDDVAAPGTGVLCGDPAWRTLATVMELEPRSAQPALTQQPRLLDRQGWSTLLAGALLLLISLTTNYGDDYLSRFRTLPAHVQIGMGLHLAALAALAGDVQLATRLRHRAERTRKREADEAARERVRAERARTGQALEVAEERERTARRARIQNGCLAAQCRFLLADTSRNRLQLSEALAVLLEELRPPNTQA